MASGGGGGRPGGRLGPLEGESRGRTASLTEQQAATKAARGGRPRSTEAAARACGLESDVARVRGAQSNSSQVTKTCSSCSVERQDRNREKHGGVWGRASRKGAKTPRKHANRGSVWGVARQDWSRAAAICRLSGTGQRAATELARRAPVPTPPKRSTQRVPPFAPPNRVHVRARGVSGKSSWAVLRQEHGRPTALCAAARAGQYTNGGRSSGQSKEAGAADS